MSVLERLAHPIAAARAAGATDVEVAHTGRTLGMSRFANSTVTTNGVVVERTTRVRAAVGDRIGAATTSGLDPDALADAARLAVRAAEHSPPQNGFTGFTRPAAAPTTTASVFAPATAAFGPADRAAVLARIFARAEQDGLLCAGAFVSGPRTRAVVTAGGVALEHQATEAQLSCIALDGDASGHAVFAGHDVAALDAEALIEEAASKAVRARAAIAVEPGAYDVVLAPAAVAELLEWLALASFSARPFLDGMSILSGRSGAPICDERITILDDPGYAHPGLTSPPFDAEGTVRRRVVLVDGGRAGPPLSDLATAARLGTPSTGHAPPVASFEISDGPVPANLVLLPGADDASELVRRVDRGLLITRFHYVNGLLDTRRAVMTGMTRDGTFMIEGGQVGKAVKNLRFTESILAALGRVGGVGHELQAIPASWISSGATLCPTLLLRAFQFTGKSR